MSFSAAFVTVLVSFGVSVIAGLFVVLITEETDRIALGFLHLAQRLCPPDEREEFVDDALSDLVRIGDKSIEKIRFSAGLPIAAVSINIAWRREARLATHHGVHATPGSGVAVPTHLGGVAQMLAREALADAICQLPSPQSRVAGLAFLDELCPREIAEHLGMNPQMVRRHLRAARNTLRPVFDEPAP
jgi:DNA-directed RNA polymerase specialized sigma24 family protein